MFNQPREVRSIPPRNPRAGWKVIVRQQVGREIFVGRGQGATYQEALEAAEEHLHSRSERSRVRIANDAGEREA